MEKNEGLTFYRCALCRGVISVWDILEVKACAKCGGRKMSPTNLTLKEKAVQIWKHPKVWGWKDVRF